jgi:hypothetical protein
VFCFGFVDRYLWYLVPKKQKVVMSESNSGPVRRRKRREIRWGMVASSSSDTPSGPKDEAAVARASASLENISLSEKQRRAVLCVVFAVLSGAVYYGLHSYNVSSVALRFACLFLPCVSCTSMALSSYFGM